MKGAGPARLGPALLEDQSQLLIPAGLQEAAARCRRHQGAADAKRKELGQARKQLPLILFTFKAIIYLNTTLLPQSGEKQQIKLFLLYNICLHVYIYALKYIIFTSK